MPMHTTDEMNRFIELRADGFSVPTVSQQLGIPASTLYDWDPRDRHHIQRIKRFTFDKTEARILGSYERQPDSKP